MLSKEEKRGKKQKKKKGNTKRYDKFIPIRSMLRVLLHVPWRLSVESERKKKVMLLFAKLISDTSRKKERKGGHFILIAYPICFTNRNIIIIIPLLNVTVNYVLNKICQDSCETFFIFLNFYTTTTQL